MLNKRKKTMKRREGGAVAWYEREEIILRNEEEARSALASVILKPYAPYVSVVRAAQ